MRRKAEEGHVRFFFVSRFPSTVYWFQTDKLRSE